MKKQTGAALIVVLSLLLGALVIGLSSMQSSLVDERLAGNQKIVTELSMGAEIAGSSAFSNIKGFLPVLLNGAECALNDEVFIKHYDSGGELTLRDDFSVDWQGLVDLPMLNENSCVSGAGLSGLTDDIGDEACDGSSVTCAYRFVTLGGVDEDGFDVEQNYIVAMSRFDDSDGNNIGVSRPLFIQVLAANPDFDLVAGSSPITFLADFDVNNVSINGANQMTLDGGSGAEVSIPPNVYNSTVEQKFPGSGNALLTPLEFITSNFDNKHGTPEVVPGGMDINAFIEFVEGLRVAAVELGVPGIFYEESDPDMNDPRFSQGGVMVVADKKFTWDGSNDFTGIIIVLGAGIEYNGGGSGNLSGSLIHAPITPVIPTYGWVDADGYTDFPEVTQYRADEWEFGNVNFSFDFNGGGNSVLSNEADSFDYAMEVITGAPGFAKATSWEFD